VNHSKVITMLVKSLVLIYRDNIVSDGLSEGSKGLITEFLDTIDNDKQMNLLHGGSSDVIGELKNLTKSLLSKDDDKDSEDIISQVNIILGKNEPTIAEVLKEAINKPFDEKIFKKSIITSRRSITKYIKEIKMIKYIQQASFKVNSLGNKDSIFDLATELTTKLDAINQSTVENDPAILTKINLSDLDAVKETLTRIKGNNNNSTKFMTGFKDLNTMTSGGPRRGETVIINALQHNYKSGFTQTLFAQLQMLNKPVMDNKDKKPLMVYLTFEDDAEVAYEFIYRYLYTNEFKKLPDINNIPPEEIATYVHKKLSANGYHCEIMRVNPDEWTYRDMFNYVLELEANGYEIHAFFCDYLAKLPTTGCNTNGPAGTAYRELFNKARNFFSSKRILFVSPHQVSTEAKQLIRNGVPAASFVKEIAGKGYTAESKQIDQVVDLELYIHIADFNKIPHLTVQRGKHRTPIIIPKDKMFFKLQFPVEMPLREDVFDDAKTIDPDVQDDKDALDF